MTDIGLGKRIATIVAERLSPLLIDSGEKPDALLLTRERYATTEAVAQGSVVLDGSKTPRFATPLAAGRCLATALWATWDVAKG